MYRRMLVLLDGSELSEVVFKYAQVLSGRLGMDLELLHVASPQEAEQMPMRRVYIEHMAASLCARAEEIRSSSGAEAIGQCIMARGSVAVGDATEEILKYLKSNQIDLVMMATRGRSGVRGPGLGGVANKVVHASHVPVWLVPAELREEIVSDTLPKRTLVIPLSGSKMSEAAIPYGLGIAAQRGADTEFVLLHVLTEKSVSYSVQAIKELEGEKARMHAYLDRVAEGMRAAGHEARTEVLYGEPATAIINYVMDNPPQLIAMATKGKQGLSRAIFGSVAEGVVQMLKKTPMLLVPAPETDE